MTPPIASYPADVEDLDILRATAYLQNAGSLWAESPSPLKREFVTEDFDSLEVQESIIKAITPKPTYAPLFVVTGGFATVV